MTINYRTTCHHFVFGFVVLTPILSAWIPLLSALSQALSSLRGLSLPSAPRSSSSFPISSPLASHLETQSQRTTHVEIPTSHAMPRLVQWNVQGRVGTGGAELRQEESHNTVDLAREE